MAKESKLLSTKDITEMFKVNRVTVAEWVNSGKLPAIKTLGGHSRVRREDLVQFLRKSGLPIPDELHADRPKILVVDDEPSILKTLPRLIWARYPHVQIDTADNGVDALLKIGQSTPDILILDMLMPRMDGVEVIQRLKNESAYAGVKIIVMSGYVKDEQAILKAGADAFFQKGSTLKELIEFVSQYLPQTVEHGR